MKKIDLALYIASVLFGKVVDETNWQVRDLMKKKKTELEDLYFMAEKAEMSIA